MAHKRATYTDLMNLPEHVVGEIIDGELVTTPRPAPPHAVAASSLGMKLGPPFQFGDGGPGGWLILDEPELHLGPDVLVPDLAGWRRERMPELPDAAWFELAPDWVCEVLSASTERRDRKQKLRIYARAQVCHAWLVDPILHTLEVLRLSGTNWVILGVHDEEDVVRAEPFEAIELALAVLWGRS